MTPREPSPTWTLMFGTGERLATLSSVLTPLAPGAGVQTLNDLESLLDASESSGTLVVDADRLSADDVVFVRRFASRQRGFRIVLVGDDATRRVARELLRLESARWIAWPPDLEHLRALAEPPGAATIPRAENAPRAPGAVAPTRAVAAPDEIAQIEAILDQPLGGRDARAEAPSNAPTPPAPPAPPPPAQAAAAPVAAAAREPAATVASPSPYFRNQVADLADIAQRIELTLNVARESTQGAPGEKPAPLDGLAQEVERLLQFTRTLGYLVAPPGTGEQTFDVGEMLEVLVAGVESQGPDWPRYHFRRDGPLVVRSDRQLLGQAFDAFFCVARGSAGRGHIVHVEVKSSSAADPNQGHVTIDFPSGALQGTDPTRAIEPYALRKVLPELGPNALAAAIGIISGQGGRAELRPSTRGRLQWSIVLPSGARPAQASKAGPAASDRKGANDPFA